MPRDATVLLEEILDELRYHQDVLTPVDVEEFLEDRTLQKAVERSLEIIGEAAKAVPGELRARHPSVPWADMVRNRDFLIHAYHRIEAAIVWRTATEHALPLLQAIEAVLAKEKRANGLRHP